MNSQALPQVSNTLPAAVDTVAIFPESSTSMDNSAPHGMQSLPFITRDQEQDVIMQEAPTEQRGNIPHPGVGNGDDRDLFTDLEQKRLHGERILKARRGEPSSYLDTSIVPKASEAGHAPALHFMEWADGLAIGLSELAEVVTANVANEYLQKVVRITRLMKS
jgi:hypothetical protein